MQKRIADYAIKELIFNGRYTTVYKAAQMKNANAVVLKTLQREYPEPKEIAQIHAEYEILSSIQVSGVCESVELLIHENKPVIVLEDFGGEPLSAYIENNYIDIKSGLEIAVSLAEILSKIHAKNIIHKDINPSNILIHPRTKEVKIIDFGISTKLNSERISAENPNTMEGTLLYMSPEQTGRMNRSIDTRTDLYSLGITLYQLFTRKLPFESLDSMEIIYSHIAGKIAPPEALNPEIPESLSLIILKLCEKTTEGRYQSASGLLYDLERCLKNHKEGNSMSVFPLGEGDRYDRFQLAKKLYGREQEIKQLEDAFLSVEKGNNVLALIGGVSGIGKTALVHEMHKPITSKNGYFISGKFDQFKTDMPFYAFNKALGELIRYVAGESMDKVDAFRKELNHNLGLNTSLMVEQVPELEILLGKQSVPVVLNPSEARNRFFSTIVQFLEVFAKPEHPLTIFIDDLQWTDDASLQLIKELVSKRIPNLFIIGAFRTNEVLEGHPLRILMDEIKETQDFLQIIIPPLSEENVNHLISDTLDRDRESTKGLTNTLFNKTAGNPFYIVELIKDIYQNEIITFDNKAGEWTWDFDQVKKLEVSTNVVEFMISQLRKLSEDCQNLLQTASVIGERFDLKTLSQLSGKTPVDVVSSLREAIDNEIIFPSNSAYKLANETQDFSASFKFVHDRIQQSAYQIMDDDTRKKQHFKIGNLLRKHLSSEEKEEELVNLVRHLNIGRANITDDGEKLELARMNSKAGLKAESATAYGIAKTYYSTGIELLPKEYWKNQYHLTYDLQSGLAKNAYLTQDFTLAENTIGIIIENAQSALDKIKMISMRVRQYVTLGKMDEAIDLGLGGLSLLGYDIPKTPDENLVGATLVGLQQQFSTRSLESILGGPIMDNEEKKEAASLMIELGLSAYVLGNADLYTITSLEVFRLTLDEGICPESSSACITMGALLGNLFGDMKSANDLGLLALDIIEKLDSVAYRCRAIATYGIVTGHYNMHWSDFESYFRKGVQAGYASGDQFMLAWSAKYSSGWDPSANLEGVIEKQRKYLEIIEGTAYQDAIDSAMINIQVNKKLSGVSPNLGSLSDEEFDEQNCLTNMAARNFYSGMGFLSTRKAELLLANEEYENAWEVIKQNTPLEPAMFSLIYLTYLCHTSFFVCMGCLNYTENPEKEELMSRIQGELTRMKNWAAHNPRNFLHWQLLMEAELAAWSNDFKKASGLYEKAILTARKNNWLYNEAYANELTAKFYHRNDIMISAKSYFREAIYLYQRRGAFGKIGALETKFADIIGVVRDEFTPGSSLSKGHTIQHTTLATTSTGNHQNLDVIALAKSYQAISEEIEFESLLEKMMRITMMTAGAERGKLILVDNGKSFVQATAEGEEIETMMNLPLREVDDIPHTVINYVSRLKEALVLDDATKDGQFVKDEYISQNAIKSILCSPILLLNELYGVIYLENNLSTEVFTSDRLQMLGLLSSQMAISINNAKVYENLEQIVAERTQQLEELNQTKDRIFAILGHDLKKPAIAFRGIAKKVNYLLKKKDYDTINLIGEGIEENAFALNNLIDNLLNWALLQKNKVVYHPKQVIISRVIQETTSLFHQIALDKNVELIADVDEDQKAWVDRNAIATAIRNLVDNALKFSNNGGKVKISCVSENTLVQISISDEGTGIPEDKMEHLFNLSKDKSTEGTVGEKGTGLGLHLVYELVKFNGGKINVESTLGKGSTFTISLPVKVESGTK